MYNVHLKIMYILKLLAVMVVDNAVPILFFFFIISILLSLSIAERWLFKIFYCCGIICLTLVLSVFAHVLLVSVMRLLHT